jgi:hypothetical protein
MSNSKSRSRKKEIYIAMAISLDATDEGPGRAITIDHGLGEGLKAFSHIVLAKDALSERMVKVQEDIPDTTWRCLVINATEGKVAAAGLLLAKPKPTAPIVWRNF